MVLTGAVESIEKMERLLTTNFPATLIKDGSKPFFAFGGPQKQQSKKFTRKWQLFPPEERATKMFPLRANVEFYFDTVGNTGSIRISDAGMELLGKRFTALVLGNGLDLRDESSTDAEAVADHEPAAAHVV